MKLVGKGSHKASLALRLAFALTATVFVPLILLGNAPSWWSHRGVVLENSARDDYAPANHGQLKNIAKAAAAEMDARLPGGAGAAVHQLIATWSVSSEQTNDFAPLNLGQLKHAAKPFYDRLIAAKYATAYPWVGAARLPHDFAVANLGQVKQLFNFDFTATDFEHDADQDGLPDWWEKYYFGDTTVDPNALAPRGDGLTNLQSFEQGLDPIRRSPQSLSIEPDRIEQTLLPGQVAIKTLTITNRGSVPRTVNITAVNNSTVKLGYTDSDQPNGPQFVWNDISVTGTHLDDVSDADDGFQAVDISFAFPYFDDVYSTVYVCSNGFVTLGSGSNSFDNRYLLPSPGAPSNLIAPFFTDLNLGESGDVYFQDDGDRVIIQFENAARYASDGFSTFQIVLERGGTIRFYYKDMEGTLNDATVGLQNATANNGLTIAFNEPYLKSGLAVAINQTAKWFDGTPTLAVVQPGAVQTVDVTLDARSLPLGALNGEFNITTDNPADTAFSLPVSLNIIDESKTDSDNDGLTNEDERRRGTNPANADTDGDGLPDGWEVANHLNPLTNDASADPDGDGFTNLQEYQNFTDPFDYTAPATFVDNFDDWSHVESRSGNWQLDNTTPEIFGGDTSRAVSLSPTIATLDYWVPAVISVDATIYYQGVWRPDQVRFFTSLDAYAWTEVTVARIADSPAGGGWRRAVISRNAAFPAANYYFRIEISGTALASNPQLSKIAFVHNDLNPPMADSQDATAISGMATALRLSARDPDGDPVSYRITEPPAHGTLTGTPPKITYTATADYVGFDRITFVANDGTRDSYPASIFVNVTPAPPRAPDGLAFTQTSNSSALLSWMGQGASSYIIERSTDGGLTWQKIGEVNGATTSFTDSTYAAGTFYSYRVRAKGQGTSMSDPSTQVSSKGTNPAIADSDGDGIVDNLEAQHHSNLDGNDTDGDGVPDGEDGAPSDPTRWAKPIERQYAVIDLGVLPGTDDSWPVALNNAGHVLCGSGNYGRYFIWVNGEQRQLPRNFEPHDLNDSDIVVGDTTYFYSPYSEIVTNGAYWINGQLIRLPQLMVGHGSLKEQTYTSSVRAINNANEIIGWSSSNPESGLFATKWVAGGAGIQLPAPLSSRVWPFAISDSGNVLAAAETGYGYDVYSLPSTRLVTSRDPGATSNGYRINSAGVIVSRGRQIWPQGATGGAAQDINSLLASEIATTLDFSYTVTNANEILADAHDGTGDADLVIFHLATATSPAELYKVIESDSRISWLSPVGMNDKGQIAATANYNDGSPPHAVLLVPAEIVPDYNRDGTIDEKDRAKVTEDNPWRWWINDDDDFGDTGGADVPGNTEHPNFATVDAPDHTSNGKIDGVRDLVDFFPLYLDIQQLVSFFPPDGPMAYTYNLKQEGGSANFVYTDLTAPRALDYLRKLVGSGLDNALALGGTPAGDGAITHQARSEGTALDPKWIKKVSSDQYGVLLVEGRKQTTQPLVLEIYGTTGERVAQVRLPLSIASVEQMYRHKNLMSADNATGGRPDYATGGDTTHIEPENLPDRLCNAKTFLFVHGYNLNPEGARGWNAEMFKRLYQSGSKARFVGVTWNGAETQIPGMDVTVNYHKNVDHAFQTAKGTDNAPGLARYVERLNAKVVVAAHSLGNVVVASAISDWQLNIDTFFMIDAAISSEVYAELQAATPQNENMVHPEWLNYPVKTYANEWHRLFSSDDARSGLSWTGRFSNTKTKMINFYSSGEEVLAEHPNSFGDPSIIDVGYTEKGIYLGKYAWALQEKLKGRIHELQSFPLLGSVYGGWGFTHNIGHPPHTPSAAEVAAMAVSSFQKEPVFDPGFDLIEHSPGPGEPSGYISVEPHGPAWVVDLVDPTKGSNVAASHRNTLLAEMFPANSLPIGSTFQQQLGEGGNFNMQEQFKVGWPYERSDQAWRHTDIREVTYSFIFPVFDTFVRLGGLNHE